MKSRLILGILSVSLAAVGLATSGYLLARHFALSQPGVFGVDYCSALFGAGCDETLQSPWAVLAGVPLAGWGVVYYAVLITLLLLGWSIGYEFEFPATLAALLLAVAAAVISLALLGLMLGGGAPFCPLCAVVHVVNFLLAIPLRQLAGRPLADLVHPVIAAGRYLLGGRIENGPLARWRLLGFFTAALVAVIVYQWVYVEHVLRRHAAASDFDAEETLQLHEQIPPRDIAVAESDAQMGDPAAPVRLVIFSDFQCPGCTQFARTLRALRNRFEGLHIVFKHFPLSSQCNRLVQSDPHPLACEAAYAAEIARRQGKFWEFHDALFATDLAANRLPLKAVARQVGLEVPAGEAESDPQDVRQKILADVEQGLQLGLDGTPAVFLNGRRVYDLRLRALEFLIHHELEHQSNASSP